MLKVIIIDNSRIFGFRYIPIRLYLLLKFLLLTFFCVCLPVAHFSCCEGLVSFQIGFYPNWFGARFPALKTEVPCFLATSPGSLVQGIGSDLQSLWWPKSWQTQKSMLHLYGILTVRQQSIYLLLLSVNFEAEITAPWDAAGLHLSEIEQTEILRHQGSLLYGDSICEKEKPLVIFNSMKQQALFRRDSGLYYGTEDSGSHSCSFRKFIRPFGWVYNKKEIQDCCLVKYQQGNFSQNI